MIETIDWYAIHVTYQNVQMESQNHHDVMLPFQATLRCPIKVSYWLQNLSLQYFSLWQIHLLLQTLLNAIHTSGFATFLEPSS